MNDQNKNPQNDETEIQELSTPEEINDFLESLNNEELSALATQIFTYERDDAIAEAKKYKRWTAILALLNVLQLLTLWLTLRP